MRGTTRSLLGAVVLTLLAATACVPDTPPPDTVPPTTGPELRTVIDDVDLLWASTSADGRWIATESVADAPADMERVLRVIDTTTGHAVELPEGGYSPDVSDDGRYVAYVRWSYDANDTSIVRVWDRSDNSVTRLSNGNNRHTGFATAPQISADGSVVAWTTGGICIDGGCAFWDPIWSNLMRWERSTGTTQLTQHATETWDSSVVKSFDMSPDGRILTYAVGSRGPGSSTLFQWRKGSGTTSLPIPGALIENVSSSADGNTIAYGIRTPGDENVATRFDVRLRSADGMVTDPTPDDDDWGRPLLSANGRHLFVDGGQVEVLTTDTLITDRIAAIDLATGSTDTLAIDGFNTHKAGATADELFIRTQESWDEGGLLGWRFRL